MEMKKKYSIVLEDSDVIFKTMTAKEKILDMVPKNKSTTAALVTTGLGLHKRRALAYLTQLEKAGYFKSKMETLNINDKICITRVFKRL